LIVFIIMVIANKLFNFSVDYYTFLHFKRPFYRTKKYTKM